MLDTDTRRRIDTARDILVGKVPDPKSQVEQITIALIYKFMDDMDAQAEAFGGKRKFFAGDFARYGWAKLMAPSVGGEERIALYTESILKMPANPGVPPLFRSIFKNAFLPYRDPETLKLFLKQIDGFTYDHSERLGDAFEYLLSVLGSQGDAGQFRTPRHIIDFIVKVVDPKKTDVVLDPACGTAGFLISAYKHILAHNVDAHGKPNLTPDERTRLAENFRGYDISPDMVRLSLANLYLHGFTAPNIVEYDTLTSQDKWSEVADVILANPPFMSPKGGIKPHDKFGVKSKRSEVLFVDYMAEHLTPTGRAGIIVPEGIIFQSQTAYTQLRETLINGYLIGVISMPAGMFMPYTNVKTSILILDRVEAKRNPLVLFSEVRQIGISLGTRRTPIDQNDLPRVIADYSAFRAGTPLSTVSWTAKRADILHNNVSLSGPRYKPRATVGGTRWLRIGDVFDIIKGEASSSETSPGPYELVVRGDDRLTAESYQFNGPTVCVPILSLAHGRGQIRRLHYAEGKFALANLMAGLRPKDAEADAKFVYYVLAFKKDDLAARMQGAVHVTLKLEDLGSFEIPLPPLSVQKDIVVEIAGYQNVIDGSRAVLDHYRLRIPTQPDWPMVELRELVDLASGRFLPATKTTPGPYLVYGGNGSARRHAEYFVEESTIAIGRVGSQCGVVHRTAPKAWITDNALYVTRLKRPLDQAYLSLAMSALDLNRFATTADLRSISQTTINSQTIPLPPLPEQERIAAEIEAEQRLVAGNRELIERFEKKIQQTLARVWGDAPAAQPGTVEQTAMPLVETKAEPADPRAETAGRFAGYVINRLQDDPHFGRVKLEKCNHLAEYHCGVPLDRRPIRWRLGPFDPELLKAAEDWGERHGWFVKHDPGDGGKVTYEPSATLAEQAKAVGTWLGEKKAAVDGLLDRLRSLSTHRCGIIATVYAAWNDLLLTGQTPNDREIINEAKTRWHESKESIPDPTWFREIRWLRLSGITPTGTGRPVRSTT